MTRADPSGSGTTPRRAVVTGASRGIGWSVALQLLDAGWSVEALGRDSTALQELQAAAHGCAGRLRCAEVDLTDDDAVRTFAAACRDDHEAVDAVVHCAGVIRRGSFAATGVDLFDEQLVVNLRAPWLLTHELLPSLTAAGGFVVFINSQQGLQVGADALGYAVSKHALRAFADGLRAEVGPSGVRVCTVFPGRTATPMQQEIFALEGRPWDPAYLLQPEDVASAVVYALTAPEQMDVTDVIMRPARKLEAIVHE